MTFSDLPLARRLERAEATAGAKFVEARQKLAPAANAQWIDVAGTYAMFDGPDSPLTQTFGLGIFSPASTDELNQIEHFFQQRHAPINHEVSPLAGVELAATLAARGYRPIEFTSVMHRPVDAPARSQTNIQTRLMNPNEQALWTELSADGWSDNPELRQFILDFGAIIAATDGTLAFLAEIDGQPVATGALRCNAGVALFAGASTVPTARNKGAQRALLEARMRHAHAEGCDLAMMCAAP